MKFPIVKNSSIELTDIIGYLEIPEDMADTMATSFANGLRFELRACVEQNEGKWNLHHVSINATPVQEKKIQ